MQIERMKTHPDERDTNISNAPNSQDSKTLGAVITYANGLLATAESNQKEIEKILETLNQTMERQRTADDALSAKWKTQIEAQARAIDLQTKAIAKAAQSVSASADGGARNGVNQALTEVRQQALESFSQALEPNLSGLKQEEQGLRFVKNEFERIARFLTWKAVGIYALVAVLPLLALLGWDWHLVQKVEGEQAIVNKFLANGGMDKITACGKDKRLCVQVDNPKGDKFGENSDYLIIKGY